MDRIIVGVDGSEHSLAALRWAASEGRLRGAEVVAVFAWAPTGHRVFARDGRSPLSESEASAHLAEAIRAGLPDAEVTSLIVESPAADALVETATPQDLIVVGARGRGGFKGLLLGSTSLRVLETAPCPVAVIQGEVDPSISGEIVVGVDGSDAGLGAVRWAAEQARSAGGSVRLVHAWLPILYGGVAAAEVLNALSDAGEEVVRVAAAEPSLDGLTVTSQVVCSGAAQALIESPGSSMIVLATRGSGLAKRMLLGSTSRQVATHATVPVVVVPPGAG